MNSYKPTGPLSEKINRSDERPLFSFVSLLVTVGLMLAAVFAVLFVLSFYISKTVSMEDEYKYFNSIFSRKSDKEPDKYQSLTNELWGKSSKYPNIKFSPGVVPGKPNAFILPGGEIFLTKGFLKQTTSENELSFVICHELGHFYKRHTVAGLSRQVTLGLFNLLTGMGKSSMGMPGIAQIFVNSKFSRSQETEADEFALSCLNNKYGHVNGFSHFFEKIKKLEPGYQNKYFSSHPITKERIDLLNNIIIEKKFLNKGELTPHTYSSE